MKYIKILLVLVIINIILFGCSKDEGNESSQLNAENEMNEAEEIKVEEENDIEQQVETEQLDPDLLAFLQELPEVPTDATGVIDQPAGRFAMRTTDWTDEKYEQLHEEIEKLEPLPKNASEEQLDQYFKFFYSLVSFDFPDPQDTIKKWEFGSFGDPNLPDSRFHFKENYNVEVLLDGSGSMGAYIDDKTMMDIAKESINDFLKNVPEEANISFRVYGHKGTSDFGDKPMSCEAIEQVYGFAPYNEEAFQEELDNIQPAGWTPLADALTQAKESLDDFDSEHHTNLIYVVSDGIETCDGDPVQVAKSLADSNAKPIINIIGFNVDAEAQKQLKEMAEVSGGIFAMANNQNELEEEFKRAEQVLKAWEDWKEDALKGVNRQEVRNSFDIMEISTEWSVKNRNQNLNLNRVIRKAYEQNLLTSEQRDILLSRRGPIEKLINSVASDVESTLKEVSAENIEDMKKQIKERYAQKTSE